MSATGEAFGQAWREYRRNFGALLAASALLEVPLVAVQVIHRVVSTNVPLPGARASAIALTLAEALVSAVTGGAIALLAINRRAGGTWGWREAWARATARLRPLLTSAFAVGLAFVAFTIPFIVFAVVGHSRPPDFSLVFLVLLLLAAPIAALLPYVAAVEKVGGFSALSAVLRLCRARSNGLPPLMLATVALFVINRVCQILGAAGPATFALGSGVGIVLRPFIMLVGLWFYWDARDLGGAGAPALAAELELAPPA
jgi:hypothetical protein